MPQKRPSSASPSNGLRRQTGVRRAALLVIVPLIALIVAAMGLVQYRNSVTAAKESVLKTDLLRMRDAIRQYSGQKGKYPSSLESLVADGYLRTIPMDPITRSRDTWTQIRANRDSSHPSTEPGVYDVKSGARLTARDGSKYSEW